MRLHVSLGLIMGSVVVMTSTAHVGQTQPQTVGVTVMTQSCDGSPVGNVLVQLSGRTIQTDASGNGSGNVAPGSYEVSATIPAQPEARLNHVIFNPAGMSGSRRIDAAGSGTAQFNTGSTGGLLQVFVCKAQLVRVRIGTTTSCTDNPSDRTLQGGITVRIGPHTYVSDSKGYIQADLPGGTYTISASYKDYPLGFVAQNGLVQRRDEAGGYTLLMTDREQNLEVRMLTCEPSGQARARAVVTEIGGSIKVVRSRANGNAFVGMQLRDGDVVTVYGTAKLKWLDGSATIVFADPKQSCVFVIGPETQRPAGTTAPQGKTVFQVLQGAMEFILPPDQNRDLPRDANGNIIKFGASSRTVAVGIKGTDFSLGYDASSQTSTIAVKEGVVSVSPKNRALKPFAVRAGEQVQVAMNRVGAIKAIAVGNVPPPQSDARRSGTARSRHGCVGFNGTWQGAAGLMRIRDGAGTYERMTLSGTVSGNVFRGSWEHPTIGRGTFIFTLAADGDSFTPNVLLAGSASQLGPSAPLSCAGPA